MNIQPPGIGFSVTSGNILLWYQYIDNHLLMIFSYSMDTWPLTELFNLLLETTDLDRPLI